MIPVLGSQLMISLVQDADTRLSTLMGLWGEDLRLEGVHWEG